MDPTTFLIYLAISTFISIALMPSQQITQPEAARSLDIPQAEEGTPQSVIFGDCWSGDWMVLAHGNYRTQEIRRG